MSTRQSLLQLRELDEQIALWAEQHQRNGLIAYQQRQQKLQESLQARQQRQSQLQADLERGQQSLLQHDRQIAQLQKELLAVSGYEASVLNHQLQPVQLDKAQQEEACLLAMLELEELEPQLSPLELELQEVTAELTEAQTEEQERKDGLEQRLQQAHRQRDQLAEILGARLFEAYLQCRQRYGQGLDEIKAGRCNRCRLELPDHVQRLLRQGEGLTCPNCQMVLVRGSFD